MSLVVQLQDLATRIATEVKSLRTLINGNVADLSSLDTTATSNLVAAINEVYALAGTGGAAILDDLTDVTITSAATGDIIRYNGSAWVDVVGTTYFQAADAALTSLAALGTATDKGIYTTGVDTFAEFAFTAAGRALLDDPDASAQLTTLGVSTFIKTLLDDSNQATALTTLGAETAGAATSAIATHVAATDPHGDRAYTDAQIAAALTTSIDMKGSVRAATTANITLSGTQTIDGVAVVAGNRVLVKDQSTGANNGIYAVAAGSWTRATDFDTSAEVTSGLTVTVEEGTTNGGKMFMLTTANPITLASTALTFTKIDAGDLMAANNLSDLTNASTARSNLGVAIGSQVQAYDADLTAIAALTSAADKLPYSTGAGTWAMTDFSSYGRTIANFADAAAARTSFSVYSTTQIGDPTTNFVTTFEAGLT